MSVIDFEGFESMGSQHFRIDNIWFSGKTGGYKATLINTYGDVIYNMTVNDTIAGGKFTKIGDNYVIFEKGDEQFTYDLIDEENQNEKNVQRK